MKHVEPVLEKDGSTWLPVRRLCEQYRVDYARKREKLLKTTIPRRRLKARAGDGRYYTMWCIPEGDVVRFMAEVLPYERGPYAKRN